MSRFNTISKWIMTHKKPVMVHGLVLSLFLIYVFFFAGPLFDRFEAIPGEARLVQMQLPGEINNMHYSLDRIIPSSSALEIQGWAFVDGHSAGNNHAYIVLKSAKSSYMFDTSAVYSGQVTTMYGGPDLNLDWCGFTTTIPMRKVDRGEYAIGICITGDEIAVLRYTNQVIVKSNNDVKLVDTVNP
jgi:hypothetical protein